MFKKILIANRGEIACRIARTCRKMGIEVATVHSAADRDALHVREIGESVEVGEAAASASYLAIDRIIEAARRVGADAVHPGYGFLAENPAFATALAAAGITFIGPDASVLSRFGDKAAAKAEARAAGVPVVPGIENMGATADEIVQALEGMEFPVLLKAAAGGGGKGMRVAASRATLRQDIEAAMREGQSAFGDPGLIAEQFLADARHIEVQILGDGRGNVIHLLDRECSLQRRHQKVIEEAPVESIGAELRRTLFAHAVNLGRAVNYLGLGTVEFIVKGTRAYFLEVNPRIQVEHPVTEEVTGLDLVELQIRAVAERELPVTQDDVRANGFALEARLYAEDPQNRFLPSTGKVRLLKFPDGIRIDTGIDEGMSVTPYYDPMIAKLIVHATDRKSAWLRLDSALRETAVLGVTTNLGFLRRLAGDEAVLENEVHTGLIDAVLAAPEVAATPDASHAAIAAVLWLRAKRGAQADDVWTGWPSQTGWRLGVPGSAIAAAPAIRLRQGDSTCAVRFGAIAADETISVAVDDAVWSIRVVGQKDDTATIIIDGRALALDCRVEAQHAGIVCHGKAAWFAVEPYLSGSLLASAGASDGLVLAPMMGRIVSVDVECGQTVTAGQRLGLMESMKMELTLSAPVDGTVASIGCTVDATVERDQPVFTIVTADGDVS